MPSIAETCATCIALCFSVAAAIVSANPGSTQIPGFSRWLAVSANAAGLVRGIGEHPEALLAP